MPIQVDWLVEGHVCMIYLSSSVSAADVQAYDEEIMARLNAVSHKVHMIVDLRPLQSLPPIPKLVSLRYFHHPNLGHNLSVGLSSNSIARFIFKLGGQVVGISVKDFASVEEARTYLHQMEGV
jgi:hypothetical protein